MEAKRNWVSALLDAEKERQTKNGAAQNSPNFGLGQCGPHSSPDCSPLDYGICRVVESRACAVPHANVDAFKASVEREWAAMSVD